MNHEYRIYLPASEFRKFWQDCWNDDSVQCWISGQFITFENGLVVCDMRTIS